VQPKVWRLPPAEGRYPEVGELPDWMERTEDVGIALEGGAARSTCMVLGTLAAVEALGYSSRTRYVCSVSGATGVAGAFSFLPPQHSTATFFGGIPSKPDLLTPEKLERLADGSLLKAVFQTGAGGNSFSNFLGFAFDETLGVSCHLSAYDQALGAQDLSAFNLFVEGSVMSAPSGTEAHKRSTEAVGPAGVKVLPMRADAPFPILAGSRLIHGNGDDSTWCSLEYTPLYSGTPIDLPNAPGGHVGGGVVESFGFNSAAPRSLPGGRTAVDDEEVVAVKPVNFVPLAKAVSVSQADIYTHVCCPHSSACCANALGGPTQHMWSPADINSKNNRDAIVGDGGPTDCCGLLALLRRRVSKVIVQCCDAFDLVTAASPSEQTWWASYFGCVKAGALSGYAMTADRMNAQCQVFDTDEFQSLVDQLVAKGKRGDPMVADVTLNVRDNPLCGVQGGWKVRLLWCFPSLSEGFRHALPEATRELLKQPPPAGFREELSTDFPYVSSGASYSTRVVRLLAESTASNLVNGIGQEVFIEFFGVPPQQTPANLPNVEGNCQ